MATTKNRDPRKLGNLQQYKNMSPEELADAIELLEKDWFTLLTEDQLDTFDKRVEETMLEFEKDYDLSDMKFNDRTTLEALSRAYVTLQDYDAILTRLRGEDLREHSYLLTVIDKLSKIASDYRRDISKMEDDLKISRKIRKASKEESAMEELKRLKELAVDFYNKVMSYVYCPKCKMLLGTIWTLYPNENNTFHFECHRSLDETGGRFCDGILDITTKELLEAGGTNHPEGFRF